VADAGLDVVGSRYFFVWPAVIKWLAARLEHLVPRAPKIPVVPWQPVNAVAYAISRLEQLVLSRIDPPFGSSILLIARPGDTARDA
jgi:hypothetical protein